MDTTLVPVLAEHESAEALALLKVASDEAHPVVSPALGALVARDFGRRGAGEWVWPGLVVHPFVAVALRVEQVGVVVLA